MGPGLRQGCLLSLLLFALVMEPLPVCACLELREWGIRLGNAQYIVLMYADDALFYLSSPGVTLVILFSLLDDFGDLYGFNLNHAKSLLFPLMNWMEHQCSSSRILGCPGIYGGAY
ncbi:hypothetical protein NDU88_000333 [Pleurodeles waltl]|uniref:Reverse transcriptase domain-containing protein n=1 Tax=Pleurodeles waltl TaxID=8319 RepID=A0AAV7S9S9_PLEWA|nr:hypothetical protein NDU88_000333 [Pleurodeles waltl]